MNTQITLRELIDYSPYTIQAAYAFGNRQNGWVVSLENDDARNIQLTKSRGVVRTYRSLDTLADHLYSALPNLRNIHVYPWEISMYKLPQYLGGLFFVAQVANTPQNIDKSLNTAGSHYLNRLAEFEFTQITLDDIRNQAIKYCTDPALFVMTFNARLGSASNEQIATLRKLYDALSNDADIFGSHSTNIAAIGRQLGKR